MAPKQTFYWDSCIFYEWLGDEPVPAQKRDGIQTIIDQNERKDNIIVTSVITHLEVLPKKLSEKSGSDNDDYLALFDGVHFHEIELNSNIILLAREIRDFYFTQATSDNTYKMMDLGDCIHLAAAAINGVDEFHTRDNDRKGSKLPLLSLYDLSGNPRLCGKYDLKIVSPESPQGRLEGI